MKDRPVVEVGISKFTVGEFVSQPWAWSINWRVGGEPWGAGAKAQEIGL